MIRISIILFCTIFFGCTNSKKTNEYADKFGIKRNGERVKLHLLAMPKTFYLSAMDIARADGFDIYVLRWFDKTPMDSCALAYKDQYIRNDSIIAEEDYIYGKTNYTTVDGVFREMLIRKYNFIRYRYGSYINDMGWKYMYDHGLNKNNEITRREADSLMKIWNIIREK